MSEASDDDENYVLEEPPESEASISSSYDSPAPAGDLPTRALTAFAVFEEAGDAFDPEVAKKLEGFILSRGGSEEAEDLYLKFRGKMPGVEALLKGRGLAA